MILLSTLMLPVAFLGSVASAVEYNAQVRAGAGVSDNILRTAENEVDEGIMTVGFNFSASEQTNVLDLSLESQFDYVYYDSDTIDEEVVGGLNGIATFTLVDERLRWVVRDNYGQQLFNPLEPASPGNREDINIFATGPILSLLPGNRNSVILNAEYSRVSYEIRPEDFDRMSGSLRFGRELSRDSSLSLNLTGSSVDFDDAELNPPFDNYSGFIRYETAGSRNTLGIDVGYNKVEFDLDPLTAGVNEGDGLLLRIDWTQTTSANGLLSISGGSQYSDQGNIFRFLQDNAPGLGETADAPTTNTPFLNNFFTLAYTLDQARYALAVLVDWSQEDYKGGIDQGNDRDSYRGNLRLRREISRTVFGGVFVDLRRREFKFLDRRDDDLSFGFDIGYRITSGFDVSFEYQHFQRNSVTPGADFTEHRAFVNLLYTPVWSRRVRQ